MRVLYTRRRPGEEEGYRSLDDLLREADVVSLHVPLTEETHDLLDARRLGLMQDGACLVNTARGAIVDHDALARALRERWIAGAGVDVFTPERLPPDHPLLACPNLIATSF